MYNDNVDYSLIFIPEDPPFAESGIFFHYSRVESAKHIVLKVIDGIREAIETTRLFIDIR